MKVDWAVQSACEWGEWAVFGMNLGRELSHTRKGRLKQGERPLWRFVFFSISKQSLWGEKNYLEPQQWFWRQLGKAAKLSTAMCQAEGWNLNPGPIIPTTVSHSTSQGTREMPSCISLHFKRFLLKQGHIKQENENEKAIEMLLWTLYESSLALLSKMFLTISMSWISWKCTKMSRVARGKKCLFVSVD